MTARTAVHSYAAMHSVLTLHHLAMHLAHQVALLHLTMHAHSATRRPLCEGINSRGKDCRHGNHCLPWKF
jgi:phosphopantetheinyl transferase